MVMVLLGGKLLYDGYFGWQTLMIMVMLGGKLL